MSLFVLIFALLSVFPGRAERAVPNDNRTPAGRLTHGVLQLQLEAREAEWLPNGPSGPALRVFAFAEAGNTASVPGPLIRVSSGTEVQATVHSTLPKPLWLRGLQDRTGAALDSVLLAPGATREFRFRAGTPGTYFYWGRTEPVPANTAVPGRALDALLVGGFVVDSAGTAAPPRGERILVITAWTDSAAVLGVKSEDADLVMRRELLARPDWFIFAVNGSSWPHTERLSYSVGDTVRWRVINASRFPHPMHLHGFHYTIEARGTAQRDTIYSAEQRRVVVTEWMAQPSTMTLTWVPTRPGNWLFHCHLVTHVTDQLRLPAHVVAMPEHAAHAETGMSGLVVGIRVSPIPNVMAAPDPRPRRKFRLFVTERANVYGDRPGYSYVLQEGPAAPAPDSIRGMGSTLVLRQREPAEITIINSAKHMTSIHWHGIELESFYDGVGGWSGWGTRVAPPIAPGDSFVVRLRPPRAGTFIYHTHVEEGIQLASGLYGALVVLPEDASDTNDRLVLLSYGLHDEAGPLVNGSATPPPIELKAGVSHRFRFINISPLETDSVQLVGVGAVPQWRALAKDGADLPAGRATIGPAKLLIHPGETYDFEVLRTAPDSLTLRVDAPGPVGSRLTSRAKGTPFPRAIIEIPVIVR